MKVDRTHASHRFQAEDGHSLRVGYDNRGDPYRKGISLDLDAADGNYSYVFLEDYEARQLRDLLLKLYPLEQP